MFLYPHKLELQKVLSCHVDAENQTQVLLTTKPSLQPLTFFSNAYYPHNFYNYATSVFEYLISCTFLHSSSSDLPYLT